MYRFRQTAGRIAGAVLAWLSLTHKRRMLDSNPITYTARPKLVDKSPEIFTVDELRALIEAAERVHPDVVPAIVIGAFAGLRDAEIKRLECNEVDQQRLHIEVKAAKAKSGRRRIVPIQPNLAGWLRSYSAMNGHVVPKALRGKIKRARRVAGLEKWPQNGLRHSYASYRLAAIEDAPRVAHELGDASPQMLYKNYRKLGAKPQCFLRSGSS